VEPRPGGAVLESGLLRRELEREDVARVVARIDRAQGQEAPQQQPGADQQHEGHRGLGRDQPLAGEAAAPRRAAAALAKARQVR
jgi:hypothetical protein